MAPVAMPKYPYKTSIYIISWLVIVKFKWSEYTIIWYIVIEIQRDKLYSDIDKEYMDIHRKYV